MFTRGQYLCLLLVFILFTSQSVFSDDNLEDSNPPPPSEKSVVYSQNKLVKAYVSEADFEIIVQPEATFELSEIHLRIPKKAIKTLTPDQLDTLERLVELQTGKFNTITETGYTFIDTVFTQNPELINIIDVINQPGNSELDSLARKKLTKEQVNSLYKQGFLLVPSQDYPGEYHVWMVRFILGSEALKVQFNQQKAKGANEIVISIPRRIYDSNPNRAETWAMFDKNGPSIDKGVIQLGKGMVNILGKLVGMIEQQPRYNQYEVQQLLLTERNKYVGAQLTADNLDYKNFKDKNGYELNLLLYDPAVLKEMAPIVQNIERENDNYWDKNILTELKAKLRASLITDESITDIEGEIRQRVDQAKQEKLYLSILDSKLLTDIDPSIPELLVNFGRAAQIVLAEEQKIEKFSRNMFNTFQAKVKFDHPTKSQKEDWLEKQTQKVYQEWYLANRQGFYDDIVMKIAEKGFKQEAYILQANVEFLFSKERELKNSLQAEIKPAITKEYSYKLPRPQVVKREHSFENGEHYIQREFKSYSDPVNVKSNYPFWRLQEFFLDYAKSVWNGNYQILYRNLWNGPLGLKVWGSNTYDYDLRTDRSNPSEFDIIKSVKNKSIWNNISSYRQAALEEIKAFDADDRPDNIVPKELVRIGKVNIGLQAWTRYGQVAVHVPGQALITTVNAVASLGLAATSLVWAPLWNISKVGFNAIIYDYERSPSIRFKRNKIKFFKQSLLTGRLFPIVTNGVGRAVGLGAGQFTLATLAAIPWHLAKAAFHYTYGLTKGAVQVAGAKAAISVFKVFKNTPRRDSWFVWRTEGPGLSSNYFYQIEKDVALLAVQAKIDSLRITNRKKSSEFALMQPENETKKFKYTFGELTGLDAVKELVQQNTRQNLRDLDDFTKVNIEETSRFLDKLHDLSNKIKLPQADLNNLVIDTMAILKESYEEMTKYHSETGIVNYWEKHGLLENDFEGLAKYFLADLFGRGFLVPLEKSDKSLKVTRLTNNLSDSIKNIYNGRLPSSGEREVIGDLVGQTKKKPNAERYQPYSFSGSNGFPEKTIHQEVFSINNQPNVNTGFKCAQVFN